MPDGMDEIARAEWKRTVIEASAMRILTTVDRGLLEKRARAYSVWIRAEDELDKNGLTYETTNQNGSTVIKANPAAAIAADAWRRYKSATVELGMTPAARSKVSTVEEDEETNPEAGYFQ